MFIAIIAALLIGASATVAAESAVPGDILYPVKVSLNEEVRGGLSLSSEARAAWEARLAERRLEEAEKLSADAKLDADARADIESRLEAHFRAFADRVDALEAEDRSEAAVEAYSRMEAALEAHAKALARITADVPSVRAHVDSILLKVRARLAAVAQARANAEAKVSVRAGAEVKAAAEGKLTAAENKIREAKAFIARMEGRADAQLVLDAKAKVAASEASIVRGKARLEAGAYGEAFVAFEQAMRVAQEAQMTLATGNSVRVRIDALSASARTEGGTEARSGSGTSENDSNASGEVRSETNVNAGNGTTSAESSGSIRVNLGL